MSGWSADKIAVPGAPATQDDIALSNPNIGEREQELVAQALESGWLAYGPFVDAFEAAIAARLEARHVVALSSGTAALHVALVLAGVQPGDEVVTSALTFVAPANAIRYAGASPVFIDAEPRFLQMDVEELQVFLEKRCEETDRGLIDAATGRRVSAVLPVHVLGHPADVDAISAYSARYGLPVIEDAAEGLGAQLRGRPVGALAGISCLSFNGNKIITTGGGGALVTDDPTVAERARYLATQAKDDPLEYVHGAVGFNYRLSNPHAAIGCAQLERLDEFVQRKRAIAERYAEGLGDVDGVTLPAEAVWAFSTYWMYTVRVDPVVFGRTSRELMRRLLDLRIQARPLWQPLHRSPAHLDAPGVSCPVADGLYEESLSLPCSTSLTDEEQDRVVEAIRAAVRT